MAATTTTRYSEIVEATRDLGETDRCPYCRNRGMITCPDHLIEHTEDPETGYLWCHTCDSAEEEAPQVGCPCGD